MSDTSDTSIWDGVYIGTAVVAIILIAVFAIYWAWRGRRWCFKENREELIAFIPRTKAVARKKVAINEVTNAHDNDAVIQEIMKASPHPVRRPDKAQENKGHLQKEMAANSPPARDVIKSKAKAMAHDKDGDDATTNATYMKRPPHPLPRPEVKSQAAPATASLAETKVKQPDIKISYSTDSSQNDAVGDPDHDYEIINRADYRQPDRVADMSTDPVQDGDDGNIYDLVRIPSRPVSAKPVKPQVKQRKRE